MVTAAAAVRLAAAAANLAAVVWATVAWPQLPTLFVVIAHAAAVLFLTDSAQRMLCPGRGACSELTPPDTSGVVSNVSGRAGGVR